LCSSIHPVWGGDDNGPMDEEDLLHISRVYASFKVRGSATTITAPPIKSHDHPFRGTVYLTSVSVLVFDPGLVFFSLERSLGTRSEIARLRGMLGVVLRLWGVSSLLYFVLACSRPITPSVPFAFFP